MNIEHSTDDKWSYWPFTIQVELVQGCNRKCQFCGTRGIENEVHLADIGTAEHLFNMIKKSGITSRILFAGHGEPTLHPKVIEFVRLARRILPKQTLHMFTNGTVIEHMPDMVDELFDAGLNDLNFDEYADHRVGEFVRSNKTCKKYDIYEAGIGVPFMAPKNPKGRRILITPPIDLRGNWDRSLTNHCGAGLPQCEQPQTGKRCSTIFRDLFIRWDGSVAICCNDFRGEYPVTNIMQHERLDDVYFHKRLESARRVLNAGRRDAIHPCRVCDDKPSRVGLLPKISEPTDADFAITSEKVKPLSKVVLREWEKDAKKRMSAELIIKHECKGGYGSPRWTGEIADCSLPLTFDTYSNCSFGCVYCFSQYQRAIGGGAEQYLSKDVKSVDAERVRRIFDGEDSQFKEYVKTGKAIQWGGLSDQFDGYERKYGKTLELLRYFKEKNQAISFSTKSTWWTKDERYLELFRGQRNWNVKFSIITEDEADAAKVEVGVPTPRERLEAIETIANLDCGGATLRMRPFIIGITSKTYKSLIRHAADAGATAMTTEFFCLERRSVNTAREHYKVLSDVIGHDIVEFYAKNSHGSGYLRLNRAIKEPYVKRMRKIAHECGMRFYVSDAHFKEASDGTCCCALPEDWDFSRCHFAEALQRCKRSGRVTFSEISEGVQYLDFEWGRAEGYNTGSVEMRAKFDSMTMKDYLRYLWNNPRQGQSPFRYFEGVMRPDGKDENDDLIYVYDQSRTFVKQGE